MDWIFDHLQVLIAAAAAIAYWLNQRRQEQSTDEEEPPQPPARYERDDPGAAEEAERARRIREEIRRKIAERTMAPVPVPAPPPLYTPREAAVPDTAAADAVVLERQRKLQEQLQALNDRRSVATAELPVLKVRRPVTSTGIAHSNLRSDLRGRRNLRRAMVLREVLGPPVGLR